MTDGPDPTRIVADIDVLAADLFVDGEARAVMDLIRAHNWIDLYASDILLERTMTVIDRLGSASLAEQWRKKIDRLVETVDHPSGDHPALGTAYQSTAAHLITYDATLRSVDTGVAIRAARPLSIRDPDAFLAVVDPDALYEATFDRPYPGRDRDPRD